MKKVTFITMTGNEWVEYTEASDDMIRLRALALNWTLVKIEPAN